MPVVVVCVCHKTKYKEAGILHKINPNKAPPALCHCHRVLASNKALRSTCFCPGCPAGPGTPPSWGRGYNRDPI